MTQLTLEFGFHPGHLELDSGPVMVRPLPDCEEPIKHVLASQTRAKDWIYAPAQQSRDFMSGAVSQKPYSARVFGLPRTHSLRHANAAGDDHLDFHLWGLSFFSGLRLTVTEAGFSTPHRSRLGNSSTSCRCATPSKRALAWPKNFWTKNAGDPRQAQRFAAAVHAPFIAQNPRSLQFEGFTFLYAALDACYALAAAKHSPPPRIPHRERPAWMCKLSAQRWRNGPIPRPADAEPSAVLYGPGYNAALNPARAVRT
jgi:hypothetical protein